MRFRLGYIIGAWKQISVSTNQANDDWNYGDNDSDTGIPNDSDATLPTNAELEQMNRTLKSYLDRLRDLAAEAKRRLQADLDIDLETLAGSDKEAAQDLFEDSVQSLADFDELVNDIVDVTA